MFSLPDDNFHIFGRILDFLFQNTFVVYIQFQLLFLCVCVVIIGKVKYYFNSESLCDFFFHFFL